MLQNCTRNVKKCKSIETRKGVKQFNEKFDGTAGNFSCLKFKVFFSIEKIKLSLLKFKILSISEIFIAKSKVYCSTRKQENWN